MDKKVDIINDYADSKQVAEHLNISESYARRKMRNGFLSSFKVFGKWLVSKEDLADVEHGEEHGNGVIR